MSAFIVVLILVAVIGIGLAVTPQFGIRRLLSRTGRHGSTWMDHAEDLPLEERPDANERDDPIPVRPLRPRSR